MQNVSRKIFYSGLIKFQSILFAVTLVPLLALKIFFWLYPADVGTLINILIFTAFALCIIGGCFYMLTHFSSVDKNLKPVTRLAEVGEMASKVAHDLRGPLSGIHAVIDLLQQNAAEKDFSNITNLLELSSKRLEHVANDLLQKYKGQEEAIARFNLHEVLDELAGEYMAQPGLGDVRFKKLYWRDAIWLDGKHNRLQRAFGNIIKNALEAMAFSGEIALTTELKNGRVLVSIKDTGPGMTHEKGQKLLREGFSEGKKDGNGIGVAFVREVVAEHSGILSLETSPGMGCLFHVNLPFGAGMATEMFEITARTDMPIVVIDDDYTLLEQWRMVLAKEGITAETYACYEEFTLRPACRQAGKAQGERSGTAIIDYHFENSELNGIEIIKKLKEQGFDNLYLCTAEYWKPSLKKEALDLGISICPKPLPKIVIARPEGRSNPDKTGIASSPTAPRN
ncbi:MAG: ATP-binding protein, partial [Deltaproteobacteria bacterium]|nr:ATP-binding protein [Deltaproteobacteria bacterium]